jgi:hypothetical protein
MIFEAELADWLNICIYRPVRDWRKEDVTYVNKRLCNKLSNWPISNKIADGEKG